MSSKPRVHHAVPPEALDGGRVPLSPEAGHYLFHVHRLEVGDEFELFDGKGRRYPAVVEVADAQGGVALARPPIVETQTASLVVIQSLLKADKLEWVLQKGTELGAAAFVLLTTHRSVSRLEESQVEKKLPRWSKIAEEASRQSGRSDVAAVHYARDFQQAVALAGAGQLLLLDEAQTAQRLGEVWRQRPPEERRALIVGPEGGWERSEVRSWEALGATGVSLGPRVLRAETASVAGLAVLQHLAGQFA